MTKVFKHVLHNCCAFPVQLEFQRSDRATYNVSEYMTGKKKPYSCRAVLALQLQCAALYGFFKTPNLVSRWHGTCVRTAQKLSAVFKKDFFKKTKKGSRQRVICALPVQPHALFLFFY